MLLLWLFSISVFLSVPHGVVIAAAGAPQPAQEAIIALNVDSSTFEERTPDAEAMLLDLNGVRRRSGLQPLTLDHRLCELARVHGTDMLHRQYFGHVTPDGRSPFDRMRAAGLPFGYAGENLALNTDTASAEMSLLNSRSHRANILSRYYKKVGIAALASPLYGELFVQEFTD